MRLFFCNGLAFGFGNFLELVDDLNELLHVLLLYLALFNGQLFLLFCLVFVEGHFGQGGKQIFHDFEGTFCSGYERKCLPDIVFSDGGSYDVIAISGKRIDKAFIRVDDSVSLILNLTDQVFNYFFLLLFGEDAVIEFYCLHEI